MTNVRRGPLAARFVRACILAAAVLGGCKKAAPPLIPATGVLLLEGKPLPHATILLVPTYTGHGSEVMAAATSDDKGRFALECGVGPGACVGGYKVTVMEASAPPELMGYAPDSDLKLRKHYAGLENRPIPACYADVRTSPLSVEIVPNTSEYELKLDR